MTLLETYRTFSIYERNGRFLVTKDGETLFEDRTSLADMRRRIDAHLRRGGR
jgi:hypothetical protein